MEIAKVPQDEQERLSELYRYNILDTPFEEEFNEIAVLASQICKTPISTISFIDRSRQWAKAVTGVDSANQNRDLSFCSHTILQDELLEVKNTLADKRFNKNPLVTQRPKIRFYAGMPLKTDNGYNLGALCVIDTIPRKLTKEQAYALKILSKQTVKLLEMRLIGKELVHTTEGLKKIISVMSHDIRSPLNSILSFINLNKENEFTPEENETMLAVLGVSVNGTLQLLDNLVEWSKINLNGENATEVFNLKQAVDECLKQAKLNLSLKKNQVINHIPPAVCVDADKAAIQFILRNLISNANKFTCNGSIKISYTIKNGKANLCVEDNGVGIDEKGLKVILQSKNGYTCNGTMNEKGSGLGLSLIKTYLNKTGNEIEIKSVVKKGTEVSFSICPLKNVS